MTNLTPPCYVYARSPLFPEECGRLLLLRIIGDGECRVGLRDGRVRSFDVEELSERNAPAT